MPERRHPVPGREKHQLGRRLPCAGDDTLARRGATAHRDQRHLLLEDWATTLVAATGKPDIRNKLLQGYEAAGKTFRVHLDGYDQRDPIGLAMWRRSCFGRSGEDLEPRRAARCN